MQATRDTLHESSGNTTPTGGEAQRGSEGGREGGGRSAALRLYLACGVTATEGGSHGHLSSVWIGKTNLVKYTHKYLPIR